MSYRLLLDQYRCFNSPLMHNFICDNYFLLIFALWALLAVVILLLNWSMLVGLRSYLLPKKYPFIWEEKKQDFKALFWACLFVDIFVFNMLLNLK
jgi:hypothetical protein